jgi:acyl dehydratase
MVFSYGLGLAATNCLNSFSYGYDRLRFIKPVFIGDTIYTIRENLSKEVHDARMGKLRVSYSVYKGEGELALYAEHLLTALYRDPDRFAAEAAAKAAERAARRERTDG